MRVLLVEDDNDLGTALQECLIHAGYTVDWSKDGASAETAILTETESFDIVVLDLGLPRRSGLEVLKTMRSRNIKTPVIIVTAQEAIDDRVKGLDAGADDYIVKPVDLDELCARIRALHRRSADRAEPLLTHGDIKLDPASHSVTLKEESIKLSRREFTLLHKLLENSGRVLSRENLTSTLYGWGDEIDSNALEVHIHNLRKKFGSDLIRTIRGVGYMVDKEQ